MSIFQICLGGMPPYLLLITCHLSKKSLTMVLLKFFVHFRSSFADFAVINSGSHFQNQLVQFLPGSLPAMLCVCAKSAKESIGTSNSALWSIQSTSCQVQESNRGNSRNSGHQVQTYNISEGTLASAYVLCPFQTLVPRFQNEKDRESEIRKSE